MTKPNFIFKLFFLLLFSLSAATAFAQTDKQPASPCYEVVLQILIASNTASGEKNAVPAGLSNVVKKLKANYNFSEYRLATTFLQRTSSSVEYKSMLNDLNQNVDKLYPTFSEWGLRNLRGTAAANGRNVIQLENFRFGARVPIVSGGRDESGKGMVNVNYESIGINMTLMNINENEPTVVGSLTTSKPDELLFLVLTVKPAE